MPILLVFVLTAACAPVPWPNSPLGLDPAHSAGFTAGAVALALSAAFGLRTWVVRTLRLDPARRPEVAHGYARLRHFLFFTNLGLVALAIVGFGWGATVREVTGAAALDEPGAPPRPSWEGAPPGAELLVPLPYFLIL